MMNIITCHLNTLQIADNIRKSVTLSNGVVVNPKDEIWIFSDQCMLDPITFSPNPNEFRPSRWLSLPIITTVDTSNVSLSGGGLIHEDATEGTNAEKLLAMEKDFIAFGYGARICPGTILLQYCCDLIPTTFIMIFKHLIIGY